MKREIAIMNTNKISKIEEGIYQGYYWMSDQTSPHLIDEKKSFSLELDNTVNPFVIEAQLYNENENISYSVKYIDGEYIIMKYDLNVLMKKTNHTKVDELLFNSHRMNGKILIFNRFWHEADDCNNNLCGMKYLEPKEMVFKGFLNEQ